jgi:hypothetical protein
MSRAETVWLKIIGVLLMFLGLTLVVSPRITYTTRERVVHTDAMDITAKRQKTLVIPRLIGGFVIAAGVTARVFANRKSA